MSHTCKSMSLIWMSHVTHEWAMSLIWLSHVTRTNESCRTWLIDMRVYVTHTTHMNEPCHTYQMSCVTQTNESCHTHEWVMSHIWMSQFTQMNEACRTNEWVMSHIWMRHVVQSHGVMRWSCQCMTAPLQCLFTCATWLHLYSARSVGVSVMSHVSMSHVPYINEPCHIWMSHATHESTHMNESSHTEHWSGCSHVTHM